MGFPEPPKDAVIVRDRRLTACLASHPVAKGHVIVFWNAPVRDLHRLPRADYGRLMRAVEDVRDAMMAALKVKKVYLLYMDEANHVHWHLIPRYAAKGFTALLHKPGRLRDFSLAARIRRELKPRH